MNAGFKGSRSGNQFAVTLLGASGIFLENCSSRDAIGPIDSSPKLWRPCQMLNNYMVSSVGDLIYSIEGFVGIDYLSASKVSLLGLEETIDVVKIKRMDQKILTSRNLEMRYGVSERRDVYIASIILLWNGKYQNFVSLCCLMFEEEYDYVEE